MALFRKAQINLVSSLYPGMQDIDKLSFDELNALILQKKEQSNKRLNYALVELENCLSENGIEMIFEKYPDFQENSVFVSKAHNCLKNLKTLKI